MLHQNTEIILFSCVNINGTKMLGICLDRALEMHVQHIYFFIIITF